MTGKNIRHRVALLAAVCTAILFLSPTGFAQSSGDPAGAKTYSPMTGKERWKQYLHDNFVSPGAYVRALGASLGDSTANRPPEWGGTAERCARNFGSQFAQATIQGTVQSSLAAVLDEDTRYHRCDCTGGWRRAGHALSRTLFTYNHVGHRVVDVPGLSGMYAGPMIATNWYPPHYQSLTDGVRTGSISVGVQAGVYVVKEFSPEIRRAFRHLL